jgi:ubiquinone/menaquinone biosynthesis C-methylase UbiE
VTKARTRVGTNRRTWDREAKEYERRHAASLRGSRALAWGVWRIPEHRVKLLGSVRGKRILELGCGAARWSMGLARRGAQVVGLDVSRERLRQAQREGRGLGRRLAFVQASAERLPFRPGTFDLAFSDWGAMSFGDPLRTIPEARRALRDGGRLAFATASPFREIARNRSTDRLEPRLFRPYFRDRAQRIDGTWEYSLPYGEWIQQFTRNGFVVERLVETRPTARSRTSYLSASDGRWARRWPLEVLWLVRREGRKS